MDLQNINYINNMLVCVSIKENYSCTNNIYTFSHSESYCKQPHIMYSGKLSRFSLFQNHPQNFARSAMRTLRIRGCVVHACAKAKVT